MSLILKIVIFIILMYISPFVVALLDLFIVYDCIFVHCGLLDEILNSVRLILAFIGVHVLAIFMAQQNDNSKYVSGGGVEWTQDDYVTPGKSYVVNNNNDSEMLMVADDAKREYGEKGDE